MCLCDAVGLSLLITARQQPIINIDHSQHDSDKKHSQPN